MLPYGLAIVVGLSSSVLFLTAFFFKDIHRPDDFFWSTIGLFYALVLWFCATGITGAVLLGQLAVVALLTAYIWQTIKLRDAIAHPEKQADLDNFSVIEFLKSRFLRSPVVVKPETPATETPTTDTVSKTVDDSQIVPSTTEAISIPQPVTPTTATSETPDLDSAAESESIDAETTPATATKSVEVEETPIIEDRDSTTENIADAQAQSENSATTESDNSVAETTDRTVASDVTAVENTDIVVEQVTIVEEETNWDDDETEDITAVSVTVIKEVPQENPPTIEAKSKEISETTEQNQNEKDSKSD